VPLRDISAALKNIRIEVELGFDPQLAFKEAQRCLNCDVQTVFATQAVHRMRRLHGHLPDGLHQLHRTTARRKNCARACARRRST
jgi:NADPH-dependent glutamate synthase beta subunit-like oxidoreductase